MTMTSYTTTTNGTTTNYFDIYWQGSSVVVDRVNGTYHSEHGGPYVGTNWVKIV